MLLTIQLSGANLHLAHTLYAIVGGQQYRAVRLPDDSDHSSSTAPLSARQQQQAANVPSDGSMVRSVLDRLQQAAVAASKAWEGERPRWRAPQDTASDVRVQVLLPASVVEQLTAAAVARVTQRDAAAPGWQQLQAQRGGVAPLATASGIYRRARSSPALMRSGSTPAAAGSGRSPVLLLHVKSDWEEASAVVELRPHVVGIVGSSRQAALLLQELLLLSSSGRLQQQFAARAAAAGGVASGSSRSSLQKVKAAAGASIAAARLTTLSKQLVPTPSNGVPPGASGAIASSRTARGGVLPANGSRRVAVGGSSSRGAGLAGVLYATLPPPRPFLPILSRAPTPGGSTDSRPSSGSEKTVSQVLRRATRQLQQQAAASSARRGATALGPWPNSGGLAGWASWLGHQAKVLGAPAAVAGAAGHGSSSNSSSTRGARSGGSSIPSLASPLQAPRQSWDVLVLCITWDADFIHLLKHHSGLDKLAAAAAAAGVQLVPVLLVEGPETAMTLSLTDLRAAGLLHASDTHTSRSHTQALLRVDAAAAQLASALQVASVQVFRMPVSEGLVAAAGGSGGSSSGSVLSRVGGLEAQHQLLSAIQRLEACLAGMLCPPPLTARL
jgi:hypothetical protein